MIWLTASNLQLRERNKSCHPHGTAAPCVACTPAAFRTACPNPRRGWVAPHRGPDMWTNWRWCRPRLLNGDVRHASPRGKECRAHYSVSFNSWLNMYYIHLHTTNNPQHKSTQGLQDYRTPQQKNNICPRLIPVRMVRPRWLPSFTINSHTLRGDSWIGQLQKRNCFQVLGVTSVDSIHTCRAVGNTTNPTI